MKTQTFTFSRTDGERFLHLRRLLTTRDRAILDLVWQHRVLTTHQMTALFFTAPNKARDRLIRLYRWGALERFQPWQPVGTAPFHWILGPLGAAVLAAERDISPRDLGYRRSTTQAIAHSQHLTHQVGVNEFFTRLHTRARNDSNCSVDEWWPERRCLKVWGDTARPDAFGRWTHTRGDTAEEVEFFLEYDNGTCTLATVAAKLAGYARLAHRTGINTPVLFWLQSPRREANLRRHLSAAHGVPVATAADTTGHCNPADAVWLPTGPDATAGPRVRLIDLAHALNA